MPSPRSQSADGTATDLALRSERLADLAQRRLALGPRSANARERARQLHDHVEGFIRPRAADLDAPLLVLLLGPTGAGKSSLLNTIAGADVSPTGVLRPTTRVAVLYATDEDARAIATGRLRTVRPDRVRRAPAPASSAGVAIVDAPDIDSVVLENRKLAEVLLETCDLCVFVTTATRYADAVPWDVLRRVRERGVPLAVVLNRMPRDENDRSIVVADATRSFARAGLGDGAQIELITIDEGDVDRDGRALSPEKARPLLQRIARLAAEADERRRLAATALAGAIRGLGPLANAVADDLDHEAIDSGSLRRSAETAYNEEQRALERELRSGLLLHAEVVTRWHDFVGADQMTRFFATGIAKLRGLLATALRGTPAAPVALVEKEMTGTIEALALRHASEAARRVASIWSERTDGAALIEGRPTLWSASSELAPALREGLATWMRGIMDDVRAGGGRKRAVAQVAALGVNVVGVAVMLAVFVHTAGLTGTEVGVAAGTAFLNQKLLEAIFGERAMGELIAKARSRLGETLADAFTRERERFDAIVPDPRSLRDLASELRTAVADLA